MRKHDKDLHHSPLQDLRRAFPPDFALSRVDAEGSEIEIRFPRQVDAGGRHVVLSRLVHAAPNHPFPAAAS
jgi:hypothetical protein